ncbi:MAG: hypothetical protein AAFY99_10110 [Pseudomonadota bacterium]
MYETPPELVSEQNQILEGVPSLGLGFKKVKIDPALLQMLRTHMANNVRRFESEPGGGFIQSENPRAYPSLIYTDGALNSRLLQDLKGLHEDWCGMPLEIATCYGIRVYQPRSYLYVHVDHATTHVVSSTICVDSRVNSPWPLVVEDIDGTRHEVSAEPGEMIFFEGARLKHGRPYPLDGDYYANIFLHYTPVGWSLEKPGSER